MDINNITINGTKTSLKDINKIDINGVVYNSGPTIGAYSYAQGSGS